MTSSDTVAPVVRRGAAPTGLGTPAVLALAVVAGVALGVLDLAWSIERPSAWSMIANSCAGWAFSAFVLGAALRVDALRSAVAAVVMLAVAVEAYYAAAVVWLGDDRSILTSPVAEEWLVLAMVAGAVFGPAGTWAFGSSRLRAAVGLALGFALLLGDAWQLAQRDHGEVVGHEPRVLVTLAAFLLVASLRRPWVGVAGLGLSLPLALVVAAGFTSAGVFA